MNQLSKLAYINEADQDQLIALTGIGSALAERIQAKRPFFELDDLLKVSGIGSELLAEIELELQAVTREDTTRPEQEINLDQPPKTDRKDEEVEETIPEAIPEAILDKESPPEQKPEVSPGPDYLSKKQTFWWIITGALFSIVLTIAITLGLLKGLNSGLNYPTISNFAQLQQQLNSVSLRVDGLVKETNDLRNRVDNLNSLTERMEKIEGLSKELEQDLIELDAQVGKVQNQSDNFLSFFQDLSQNLTQLLEDEEINNE